MAKRRRGHSKATEQKFRALRAAVAKVKRKQKIVTVGDALAIHDALEGVLESVLDDIVPAIQKSGLSRLEAEVILDTPREDLRQVIEDSRRRIRESGSPPHEAN